MKKLIFIVFVALLGTQTVNAGSYQRWIVWVSDPNHIANQNETADIFAALSQNTISANGIYQVGGNSFKIQNPELYFEYLKMVIKKSDPHATTIVDMIKAIKGGEKTQWGNDISVHVKNYWVNSNGQVTFTDNYSGAELGVWVLLINGIPTIKLDCGNPLEYEDNYVYTPTPNPNPNPVTPSSNNGGGTTNNYTNCFNTTNSNNSNSFNTTTTTGGNECRRDGYHKPYSVEFYPNPSQPGYFRGRELPLPSDYNGGYGYYLPQQPGCYPQQQQQCYVKRPQQQQCYRGERREQPRRQPQGTHYSAQG